MEVEGSVAKYFATEAGNAAAEAAIQALGGYGYIREYEVEKIRRDVRITTIYEGTSEIMQKIIGVFRWRSVVRTDGGFYSEMATTLRDLGEEGDRVGAQRAALAADALAQLFLLCHSKKLPREQHILFQLAHLATEVETAVALSLRASGSPTALLAPAARLHAGAAAREVAVTGLEMLQGSGKFTDEQLLAFRQTIQFDAILGSSANNLADMGEVAAAIIDRYP
jgi:acyl-CoA dehydrogenase